MINNPDIQPNATLNRWIASILLFEFKLRHIPGKDHVSAYGLSRRPKAPEDPTEVDDTDDWIDHAYSFAIDCLNRQNVACLIKVGDTKAAVKSVKGLKISQPQSPMAFVLSLHQVEIEILQAEKSKAKVEMIKEIKSFLQAPEQPISMD